MTHHTETNDHSAHNSEVYRQKFWISLALTLPTLVFSPMIQAWLGVRLEFPGSGYLSAIFGVAIFLYGGLVFLKGAVSELKHRQPGMMTLISMAISVAFIYSLTSTIGLIDGMDFWWELATLVTIMLLGHWLEMAAVAGASGALKELAKLLPDEAELVTKKGTKKVPVGDLYVGDLVLVRPGGQVPADGEVTEGESEVNEAMFTGESRLVKKRPTSQVIGGTVNGSGALMVRVLKTGDETMLSGIMKLVAEAEASKSKTQLLADKAAGFLTYGAIVAALTTWYVWAAAGQSPQFILERVVTVLVVACPHALGLAIPLVASISTTLAARNGLLIRKRQAMEVARLVDMVVFDKTGTLTQAEQGVVEIATVNGTKDELLVAAAGAEALSEHSIAKAIVKAARTKGLSIQKAHDFSVLPGRGAVAKIAGRTIQIGGPQLVMKFGYTVPKSLEGVAAKVSEAGQTAVYVVIDGTVGGVIVLSDMLRPESKEAIAGLQGAGKKVAIISGDSEGVTMGVAKALGVGRYYAEILPNQKASIVAKLQHRGKRVAMVGDGVNDAPALARATIGIAIGAGTNVAVQSADIVLVSNDPRSVAKVFSLSEATYRKMMQNLLWATGYNVLAIPLAAGAGAGVGYVLSPAAGAVLMSLSTIIVAVNAQLLRKVRLS